MQKSSETAPTEARKYGGWMERGEVDLGLSINVWRKVGGARNWGGICALPEISIARRAGLERVSGECMRRECVR